MTEKPKQLVSDIMDQAVETLDMAVQNGVRLQEEASRWWSGLLGAAPMPMQSMTREATSAVEQARPMVQQAMEDGLRAIDRSWRSGMDLFRKMIETGQSAAVLQQKAQQLWEASMTTIRSEMQSMAEANARAIERWSEMARENAEGMTAMATRQASRMRARTNGSERETEMRQPQKRSRSRRRSRRKAAK